MGEEVESPDDPDRGLGISGGDAGARRAASRARHAALGGATAGASRSGGGAGGSTSLPGPRRRARWWRSTAKPGAAEFDEEDLRLLQAFAASAATAVATAQRVESERLQQQVEIGERERQALGAGAPRRCPAGPGGDPNLPRDRAAGRRARSRRSAIEKAAEETVERLEVQINELSRLINDLRPASLERLGLAGALEALAEDCSARGDLAIETEIEIDGKLKRRGGAGVYRLVQEALNNVRQARRRGQRNCLRSRGRRPGADRGRATMGVASTPTPSRAVAA